MADDDDPRTVVVIACDRERLDMATLSRALRGMGGEVLILDAGGDLTESPPGVDAEEVLRLPHLELLGPAPDINARAIANLGRALRADRAKRTASRTWTTRDAFRKKR